MSELPSRLKAIRSLRGLTQRQLAKKMAVSPSTIALYETGNRNPDPQMLRKLADCLNCSVDYLLGRTLFEDIKGDVLLLAENSAGYNCETEAAHRTDDPMDDLPEEAKKSLEEFKEFIFRKYGKGSK